MIKNSTLRAFIAGFFISVGTATITAGVCTNWFRTGKTSSSSISEISSVIDSSLESSKSEISSEESTSSLEESISSGSSAASSLAEESSSEDISSSVVTSSSEESSSVVEDPTARTSFDSIADWESYYNEAFFSSESKYYQDFNQIMTDVENEAHLNEEQFNQKITNDLLACNFVGINFTNIYKDDDITFLGYGTNESVYSFAIDDKNLLTFNKGTNSYFNFDLGSVDNGGFITSTSEMLWGFGKMMFTDGAEVTDLYYQTKDFSIANLNGTVIKDSYTYNGTNESKIGFAANLNINFENEKFSFSQTQMDEINSLLTAKNLALSEHQLSHITII